MSPAQIKESRKGDSLKYTVITVIVTTTVRVDTLLKHKTFLKSKNKNLFGVLEAPACGKNPVIK